jgi:pyrroloquinoline quinone biosynthesis protein D
MRIEMESNTDKLVPVLASGKRLQWEEAQDCFVILYPEGMVKLSESAGAIMQRCDGKRTSVDIIDELNKEYPEVDLANDVVEFLNQAIKNGWLRNSTD